ncbi:MAG: hypothetical protein DCC73_14450 [Proteobacteria bacterium]|nr:MAG: hypothetical protein DCC73_14450 [Pseudomonadota bacterium]
MAMTNAERQKRFRERLKAKAAGTNRGPDVGALIHAASLHHDEWGLSAPDDAAPTVRNDMYGVVLAAMTAELLRQYPFNVDEIDLALRNVINHLLALVGLSLDDLPNPTPADILASYPTKTDRRRLKQAINFDWEGYAAGDEWARLTLADRLRLYRYTSASNTVT